MAASRLLSKSPNASRVSLAQPLRFRHSTAQRCRPTGAIRNLFGEGERLRVDGSVSQIGSKAIEDLEFDAGAVFSKPGILDIDTELFSEFRIKRERPDVFENRSALAKVGLSHTFSPALSGSLAAQGEFARIEDAYGVDDYVLLSAPGELFYDSRDNRLDPSSGISAMFHASPTVDVAGGAAFLATQVQIASYVSLGDSGRAVLAGRLIGGSVFGADLADVPATSRFFAGGGGSVRGYEFRSLGPAVNGDVVGGLSTAGASGELRLRVTEQFGIVPFVDVAIVSADSVPRFSEAVYVGAGVGVRYYTSLGPLRLDVAVPLTNRERQSDFGVYVGLGQTF